MQLNLNLANWLWPAYFFKNIFGCSLMNWFQWAFRFLTQAFWPISENILPSMSNEFMDGLVGIHPIKISDHNEVCFNTKIPEFRNLNEVPGVYDSKYDIESLVEIPNDLRCFQITFIKIKKVHNVSSVLIHKKPVTHWTVVSWALLGERVIVVDY